MDESLLMALNMALALPKNEREQPINVAHIKLLLVIYHHPDIKTDELLPFFANEKPTLISRLNFLYRKKLITKLPKFNAGGNANPNYYRATHLGAQLVKLFRIGAIEQLTT